MAASDNLMLETGTAAAEAPAEAGVYAWYCLVLLTASYTLNSIDRNLVLILAEPIKAEYRLTDSAIGMLVGLVYAVSFTLAGIPLGLLVDRVNRARLAAGLLAAWSALTFVSGLAHSYLQLALARFGVAGAESGASPAALSLIADLFPRSRRSSAMGWFYFSTPIGLAVGFAMGGLVAAHLGWRAAFFVAGAPGLLLATVVALTLKEPKRGVFDEREARSSSPGALVRLFRERPALAFLLLAAVTQTTAQAGIGAFLAPFLIRVHQMTLARAGLLVALALGGGSAIGMPLGGWLGDRLGRERPGRPAWLVAIAMALAGACAVAAFLAPTALGATVLAGLYAVLLATYYGPTFSSYLSIAPASMRGAVGALMVILNSLVGYGLGPPLGGAVSDLAHAVGAAAPLRWALIALSALYLPAGGFFWLASRTLARDLSRG